MRTLAVAAITGLIALAMASVASAAPTVSMVWTATTGSGTVGGSSIDAVAGDILTLDILVNGDANGVSFAGVSYDISAAGTVLGGTLRAGIDSINDGLGAVFTGVTNTATNTGGALLFVAGSAATCPFPATGNLLGAGFCGDTFFTGIPASQMGADLGGGLIGTFAAGPGGPTSPGYTFTIAQAQFEVVPEPATGGLLALGLGALAFIGRRRA